MTGNSSKPNLRAITRNVARVMNWGARNLADDTGAIAMKFALALPLLAAVAGGAVDFASLLHQKSALQSATDAASLAAARELSLSDAKRENVSAVVEAVVKYQLRANENVAHGRSPATIKTVIRDTPLEVDVTATQTANTPFGLISGLELDSISVRSVARVVGQPNVCVLGLNPQAGGTISLEHRARVTGSDCAVFSNSTHANGIAAKNSSTLKATFICSRGGRDGGPGNFEPAPLTDCPSFEDPLASRPEPVPAACDPTLPTAISEHRTLLPGTYCGGLTISGTARVMLSPGIYIFKDGPLVVADTAELSGTGVGLFFSGNASGLTFEAGTTIALSAPTSGVMAGLLMFSSRNNEPSVLQGLYKILSNNARTLVGTIYLPTGILHIDADEPVADYSAYTAIVADRMRLFGGPHLVLNTNYSGTDIPVPDGIKGAGQPAALVE
jgi:Flp pilus assembly protein TadG